MAELNFGDVPFNHADLTVDTGNRVWDYPFFSGLTRINARRHGCTGDGVTDDTSAMTDALDAAIVSNSILDIPAGTYLVSDGVLNSFTATSQTGLYVRGDSWGGTTLKLADPGTGTAWFWDNDEVAKLERARFEHITFQGAEDTLCNGFKIWSTGHDKDFKFYDCRFYDLNTVMHTWTTSDANGDHMGFLNCAFPNITGQILYLNNAQSVAHSFVNCTHYGPGHFIHCVKGGSVNVVGGSYNFLTGDGVTPSYVVYAPTGGTVGPGNDGFWFTGVRFEFGAANNKCVYSELGTQHIVFDKCNMFTNIPLVYVSKVGVTIKETGNVTFRDCHLPDWAYLFDDSATSYFAGGPYIFFDGCALPYDVSEKISCTTQVGRVRAVNCVPYSTGPGWGATKFKATDFDWNWRNTPLGGMCPDPTMKAVLKPAWTPWPKSDGNEYVLTLPQTINGGGVRVKAIHLRKPGDGSTTTNNVEYIVGLNDKSEILARTMADHRSNAINLDIEVNRVLSEAERLMDIGTTGADVASLRLWVDTNDTTSVNPGEVWVEYD